ncbi:hypothetical protein JVT61DRAFT_8557 [Boletus reticuloceps]|uniref:Integrase core domain-containing protein n=1 Tax=Boletus reticuloceps TaxID=495285 RepID=A0A8I2YXC7_9AGAM|nr:hypothetical protein JVT61DRAFT_7937 [Boletus reticuloceps]KAG6380425.1 hypothetical protein JVT61DRAFT_8557 [Boletus reticuloceps]
MSDTEEYTNDDVEQHIPNPTGKNQHKDCPSVDDERVAEILREYHRRNLTNKRLISKLLLAEHGIQMSEATVTRRRKLLGLHGSRTTSCTLPVTIKRQLVLDQMAKDPARRQGPDLIKEGIAFACGVHISRDFVTAEMRQHDPTGFELRDPTVKKILRQPLVALGPHHEWSGDGHDKLSSIGFPIWGIRDKWSGKWLGLWVVPNNRLKTAIAYLYLTTIENVGGMPLQTTTDCGSETTQVFGLANALREEFAPEYSANDLPPHRFLRSVKNIVIERGWLRVRLQWGANVKIWWEEGEGIYNSTDPLHYELVQWLWPKFIQEELDHLRERLNNHPTRFDASKRLPSGVSPNVAIALAAEYGGTNCLLPVDLTVIHHLKAALGGEKLLRFVSVEFADHAEMVFETLGIETITSDNIWDIFTKMLPLIKQLD